LSADVEGASDFGGWGRAATRDRLPVLLDGAWYAVADLRRLDRVARRAGPWAPLAAGEILYLAVDEQIVGVEPVQLSVGDEGVAWRQDFVLERAVAVVGVSDDERVFDGEHRCAGECL
jgi:hypothetical protein